jgi:hypothetical protein
LSAPPAATRVFRSANVCFAVPTFAAAVSHTSQSFRERRPKHY